MCTAGCFRTAWRTQGAAGCLVSAVAQSSPRAPTIFRRHHPEPADQDFPSNPRVIHKEIHKARKGPVHKAPAAAKTGQSTYQKGVPSHVIPALSGNQVAPVDNPWITWRCLCTVCASSCGKQNSFSQNTPLNWENSSNRLCNKSIFRLSSSTASMPRSAWTSRSRPRPAPKYAPHVMWPTNSPEIRQCSLKKHAQMGMCCG